jgi:hypothetical protein
MDMASFLPAGCSLNPDSPSGGKALGMIELGVAALSFMNRRGTHESV